MRTGFQSGATFTTIRNVSAKAPNRTFLTQAVSDCLRGCGFAIDGAGDVGFIPRPLPEALTILGRRDFRDYSTTGTSWKANWRFVSGTQIYVLMGFVGAALIVVWLATALPSALKLVFSIGLAGVIAAPLIAFYLRAVPRAEFLRVEVLPTPRSYVDGTLEFDLVLSYGIADRSKMPGGGHPGLLTPEPTEFDYVGIQGFLEDFSSRCSVAQR